MLVIRDAQLAVFGRIHLEEFVRRAIAHVRACFAAQAADLGDEGVERSVRTALDRCRQYALPSEGDVLRYLNLMYALGFDFDADPALAWAGETLRDAELEAATKLGLLAQRAAQVLAARERAQEAAR